MAIAFGKALIIGLGGTGQKALVRIKRMFLDHCGGELPPCIQLLAFDTTSNREDICDAQGRQITFSDNEFLYMRIGSVSEAIKSKYVKDWWIPYAAIDRTRIPGYCSSRQVGHLSIFVNIAQVTTILKRTFDRLNQFEIEVNMQNLGMELLPLTPQVIVIGSLAGGTGSGMFVDMSILCRILGGQNMLYTAHLVMPWVYYDVARRSVYENAYAALLELEYINNCSVDQPYNVQYSPQHTFTLKERPYHIVNLIDGQCRNGTRITEHSDLVQFIGEVIFNSVGATDKQASENVVVNIMKMIYASSPANWDDRQARYSTYGISSIVYPGAEIHERYSIEFAIKLIERTLEALNEPVRLPLSETSKNLILPFIVANSLEVKNQQLLELICPSEELPVYALDKSINLRDPDYLQDCKFDLDKWSEHKLKQFVSRIEFIEEDLKENISKAISKLLNDIKEGEAAKKEKYPKGSYGAALSLLNAHLNNSKIVLLKMKSQLDDNLPKYTERSNLLLDGFPSPPRLSMFPVNPQRNTYSNYAEVRQQEVQCQWKIKRIEIAVELCEAWINRIGVIANDVKINESERESAQGKLKDLISDLYSRGNSLRSEQLRMRQSLFEIYIGDVTEEDGDQTYVSEGFKELSIEDAFKEFQWENGITDWGKLGGLTSMELDKLFMGYSRRKLRSTDVSVLDVLKDIERRKEGTMARIIREAVNRSALLLPLNDSLLAGKDKDLSEFFVIGGEDKESLAEALDNSIPSDSRIPNLWASTGDRYRITICRYFAAIPLHVINGIKDIRAAYLKRFRPPSHTNLSFEFELPDAIPEKENETRAFALLCLALLEVNENKQEKLFGLEQEALIVRINPLDKPKYYRLDPLVLGKQVTDEEDLRLPGMPPGKFYTLYDELCKDFDLQKRLEVTLSKLMGKPGFTMALVEDARRKIDDYKTILRRAQEGEEPSFNQMRTGIFYYKAITFYIAFVRKHGS